MDLKLPWAEKRILWAFQKSIFQAFPNFWVRKLKHISGDRNRLRKWFWSYLQLKNECSERLKRSFFSFLQIFEWRSGNHFLTVSHRKLFRKWFCSYLELKNECSECFKKAFLSFLQISESRSWNNFRGKWRKPFTTI